MKIRTRITRRWSFALVCGLSGTIALAGTPAPKKSVAKSQPKLCGRIEKVGGLTLLSVWGTPRERGYAHGYLLGAEIKQTIEQYLDDEPLSGGAKVYERIVSHYAGEAFMPTAPRMDEELHGMLAGMTARLGGKGMTMAPLKRPLDICDLRGLQCAADTGGQACSSFAAWGKLTKDGTTIAGRNLDWFASKCVVGHCIVLVEAADPDHKRLGWVSATWPGAIGCYTGMNETGLTLSIHDVAQHGVPLSPDISPRALVLREAIEQSAAASAMDDVSAVLKKFHVLVGSNLFVALPARASKSAAFVVEYDGWQAHTGGVTLREPAAGSMWEICTNHYRARDMTPFADDKAGSCGRYDALLTRLQKTGDTLDVSTAWKMLGDVAMTGATSTQVLTQQSVVFQPDALLMNVAFAQRGTPAVKMKPHMLNVRILLKCARP